MSAASFFTQTIADLAGRCHCIAPDLRGFGLPERAPVDARRGLRDFSDDLHALLTSSGLLAGGQPPVLLGWSPGRPGPLGELAGRGARRARGEQRDLA